MNLWLSVIIIIAAVVVAIAAILLVRRRAPDGGFFNDSDRAAGVFGVLATAFSVLLAFVIFLGFTAYDSAKSGAEQEALTVAQQFETAEFLPSASSLELEGDLVCYGRAVVSDEWPLLARAGRSATVDAWAVLLFHTLEGVQPRTASEQAAYQKWLDQTSDRESGRRARLHAEDGVISAPLWFILILAAILVLGYMLFFADRGERRKVQALLIGTVTAMVVTSLLVVNFLNNPYASGAGALEPTSMTRTLETLDGATALLHPGAPPPCDERGRPREL